MKPRTGVTNSPCTAIAFLNGSLTIASNSVKTEEDQRSLLDGYKQRLTLLKDCLSKLKETTPADLSSCCSIQGFRLALPGKNNKDSADIFKDFLSKLHKENFIINGFNILDILSDDEFLDVNIVITLFTEKDLNLHAEQVIFARAKALGITTRDLIIGVNKLCCQTCARVLLAAEENAPRIRGTHMFSYHKTASLGDDLKYEEIMRLISVNEGEYDPDLMTASCVVSRTASTNTSCYGDFPEHLANEGIGTTSASNPVMSDFFSMKQSSMELAHEKEKQSTESYPTHYWAR